jgi:PAS domain S-box/PAS domain S-box
VDRRRDLVAAAPLSELEERDGRFRALVESAFDAYYDWNIETGYNYFSEPLDALLGYRPGTLKWSFYAWFERVHPDDRRRVMGSLGTAFRHENHWQDDYRLRKRDNSYVFVRDNGLIIYGDRMRPVRMLGVIRDITQERERARALSESAELYRTLFAGAANPAVHVDREGCYLDANEAALGFFECSKEELLSRRFSEDFSADVVRLVDEAFSMKGRVESEVTIRVKGAPKTLVLAIVPCRIGERDTFFCLGTDISSRQMLQERLEDVNTALRVVLEQTNQDKQDLERRIAANIALLVAPTLDRLERLLRSRPEVACVQAVRENLNEIVRPFASRLTTSSESCVALSRRELEIANYVRLGKTTDEIAEVLCVSRSAVQFHRGNIRRKLGLKRGDQQLATALDSILADEALKL